MNDLQFVEDILELIELAGIPAPAPIEQRWSSASSSAMSIVSNNPDRSNAATDTLYSWIGIIMQVEISSRPDWTSIGLRLDFGWAASNWVGTVEDVLANCVYGCGWVSG